MNRFVLYHAVLAAALPLAIAVKPVAAQFTQSGNAYYVTGDYTLAYDVSGNDVYVGKDTAFNTLPGTATFTVAPGANVTFFNTYTNGSTAFYSLKYVRKLPHQCHGRKCDTCRGLGHQYNDDHWRNRKFDHWLRR